MVYFTTVHINMPKITLMLTALLQPHSHPQYNPIVAVIKSV